MKTKSTHHLTLSMLAAFMLAAQLAQSAAEPAPGGAATGLRTVPANQVAEIVIESGKAYQNPFMEVVLDAIVTPPDGKSLRVPAFWAGGNRWCFRYASAAPGVHTWRSECSDSSNATLHGIGGKIEVDSATGDNPLYRHGPLRVAKDQRHFEHADGTPFFWLGDTWWKGLCKRLTWQGFQELTADRKAKGFTLVQIVCGPYPDEGMFEPRWENEGGMPYLTKDFSVVNPKYFEYSDRRIQHLVEQGIVPAIVGGWGREQSGGKSTVSQVGADGYKRHWRHLVARYGAYPAVWIAGGEAADQQGPWGEVLKYLREVDPYRHLLTYHAPGNPRQALRDNGVCDFDMVALGHDSFGVAAQTLEMVKYCLAQAPTRPALSGEACYEGHMQINFQDVQRHLFWSFMLSGAAGHTYGAAGIWHSSVDGDPGITPVYDWTSWKDGMNYPGSTQLGLGKKLLEKYPWSRLEAHPEWAEAGCYAAGIPGEVCFIYLPRRNPYNWSGPVVRNLEPGRAWQVYYFDPASGRKFDQGRCVFAGPGQPPFAGHTQPKLVSDRFGAADAVGWKDYGTPSQRTQGRLVGGKGMLTVVEKIAAVDGMASADANSDTEAGIILRFHDADNYLVALYSPLKKAIFLHDRKNGQYGEPLGSVAVPEIGPRIHLAAAASGDYAAMVLTDGTKNYHTPSVRIGNVTGGSAGLWFLHIGERQEFGNFELSATPFVPAVEVFQAPVPSPQDWVLVLDRVKP